MPIFNKLRKTQIKTEGMKRYLLYAIGEIVLVVVGILIALEINEWSDRQKEREKEKLIIANLHQEFSKNTKQLSNQRHLYDQTLDNARFLMDLMGKPESEIKQYNTDSLISLAIDISDYRPTSNVMTELMGSGKLNLLTSDALKNELFQWAAGIEQKKEAWATLDHFNEDQVMPYLIKHASLRNIDRYGTLAWKEKSQLPSQNTALFKQTEFENTLDNYMWSMMYFKQTLDSLENTSQKIVRLTH